MCDNVEMRQHFLYYTTPFTIISAGVMYAKLSRDTSGGATSINSLYDMSIWISPMFEAFPTAELVMLYLYCC